MFAAPDRNTVGPVDQTASPWRTEDTQRMVGTTRFRQQGPFSLISMQPGEDMSRDINSVVTPAKAGVQGGSDRATALDSRLRGNDK